MRSGSLGIFPLIKYYNMTEIYKNLDLEDIHYFDPDGIEWREEWTPITLKGFEDRYHVSTFGRVKSLNYRRMGTESIIRPVFDDKGYLKHNIFKNRKSCQRLTSRLVAIHFIPNPENKPEVNHINGKMKTCNAIWNLEWNTPKENIRNAFETGLMSCRKGVKNNGAKLNEQDVLRIRSLHGVKTLVSIAKEYKLNESTVSKIVHRKSWTHI